MGKGCRQCAVPLGPCPDTPRSSAEVSLPPAPRKGQATWRLRSMASSHIRRLRLEAGEQVWPAAHLPAPPKGLSDSLCNRASAQLSVGEVAAVPHGPPEPGIQALNRVLRVHPVIAPVRWCGDRRWCGAGEGAGWHRGEEWGSKVGEPGGASINGGSWPRPDGNPGPCTYRLPVVAGGLFGSRRDRLGNAVRTTAGGTGW